MSDNLAEKILITCDPQPTLLAFAIRFPNGEISLIGRKLSTSKSRKSSQILNWLNNTPERIHEILDDIFRSLKDYCKP